MFRSSQTIVVYIHQNLRLFTYIYHHINQSHITEQTDY